MNFKRLKVRGYTKRQEFAKIKSERSSIQPSSSGFGGCEVEKGGCILLLHHFVPIIVIIMELVNLEK